MFTTFSLSLKALLNYVQSGKIQLPDFQRGWVWDEDRIRGLLASISRGFPVGAVMTLSAGGDIRGLRPISGPLTLKENERSLTKMNERPVAPNDTNRRSAGSVQPAHMVSVGVTERPIWKRPRTSTNPKAPGKTPVSCGS